ncbi:unnamed protein product [Ectocarpus sp. 12 AP-2014]
MATTSFSRRVVAKILYALCECDVSLFVVRGFADRWLFRRRFWWGIRGIARQKISKIAGSCREQAHTLSGACRRIETTLKTKFRRFAPRQSTFRGSADSADNFFNPVTA